MAETDGGMEKAPPNGCGNAALPSPPFLHSARIWGMYEYVSSVFLKLLSLGFKLQLAMGVLASPNHSTVEPAPIWDS